MVFALDRGRLRGAGRVLGVDLSAEMLRVAQAAEEHEPLGIEYLQHDVGAMPRLGSFDGALGAYRRRHLGPSPAGGM